MFRPHLLVKLSIVGSLRDREVGCSASDRQGLNFESCVWRAVSSHSSHHPQEVLLSQFSLYVHKGGIEPDSFHFLLLPNSRPGVNHIQANTRRRPNVGLLLTHRLRRWPSSKPALSRRPTFAGTALGLTRLRKLTALVWKTAPWLAHHSCQLDRSGFTRGD